MSYIKVFSGSMVAVQHVKQLLQEKNIEPIVKDQTNSASMAGFGSVMPDFQELFVHSDEESKAKEVLSSLK